jgi:hypothetical protein
VLAIGLVAGGIFHFYFKSGMLDFLVQQLVLDFVFQLIDKFHGAGGVDYQVGGECILRRADGPNMDMMKVFYSIHFTDSLPDLSKLDAFGHPIQGQAKAIPQQLPGTEEDDDGYQQAQNSVQPEKTRKIHDNTTDYQRGGYDGI